jgi:parvulin-like peptidyl-prolyl isomerase
MNQNLAMKAFSVLFLLGASFGWAQTAPTPVPPETVIATLEDGTKITQGDLDALTPLLSQVYEPTAEKDPHKFLTLIALFKKAAAKADSEKLTDQAPYKQGLDFAVMEAKARFWVQKEQLAITVPPEEAEAFYNDHKDMFRHFKVSAIKVAFGGVAPEVASSSTNASRVIRPVLNEDEAKAKAEKLVAQIRGGADFAKLVLTESDDESSKEKGGYLGTWSMTDNVPDALRTGVMNLQEGQVSDPIRQVGGYYIMRVDAITYTPFADTKDILMGQIKQQKAGKMLDDLYKSVKVEFPKNDPPPAGASEPKK